MIEERSYGLRVEFDGDVFLSGVYHIVIIGGVIEKDPQKAEDELWRETCFIAHHGYAEIHIIAFGYNSYDDARQSVIEALFNMPKILDCSTISDNHTTPEGEVWVCDTPF